MKNNYEDKLHYLNSIIIPRLKRAFQRGDAKYVGIHHSHDPDIVARKPVDDIRHIRELHVDVRLREAEEAAGMNDLQTALEKMESAIGYLVILHMRTLPKYLSPKALESSPWGWKSYVDCLPKDNQNILTFSADLFRRIPSSMGLICDCFCREVWDGKKESNKGDYWVDMDSVLETLPVDALGADTNRI